MPSPHPPMQSPELPTQIVQPTHNSCSRCGTACLDIGPGLDPLLGDDLTMVCSCRWVRCSVDSQFKSLVLTGFVPAMLKAFIEYLQVCLLARCVIFT
eukprot:1194185-Prorocentrum_minimum.AAC.3